MKISSLYRLSGLCLIASFVLSLAGGVLHPIVDGDSHSVEALLASRSPGAQLLIYAGAVCLMLGLPGGYAWFRERLGTLGFIGFVGYMIGNALSAMSHLVVEAFVAPVVAADPDARHLIDADGGIIDSSSFITLQVVAGLTFMLSMLVIGIAIIRAQGIPTWIGAVMVVGALALTVPLPEVEGLTGVLIELPRGLMVASLGVIMLRELSRRPVDEPVLVA